MGLVVREQRCHEGIHHGFGNSVADGKQEHTPEQTLVGSFLTTGSKCRTGQQRQHG